VTIKIKMFTQYNIWSKIGVLNFITVIYSLHWSSKTVRHQK